ncbi:MAG: hypothetical protein FJ197_07920 [Gammaproteobacteria bacterium]|nr:hypothetical protein [Gammaproteobacteria bacterium]
MHLSACILAVLLAATSGLGPLLELEWPDQRGGSGGLVAHRGQVAVVVVVDARRLAQVRRWEEQLLGRYPDLPVVTVADVDEDSKPELERVRTVLARRVPPEVSVLIDLERDWARTLSLDTGAPNILVLGGNGNVVEHLRGRWTAEGGERLLQSVARLRQAA